MTREVVLREVPERDECMLEHCRRPALPGTAWARYCDVHTRHAAPTEGVETFGYVLYRRLRRGE